MDLTNERSPLFLKVELVGKGNVFWQETRSDANGSRTDTFNNSEEYVEHEVIVHQGRALNTTQYFRL